MPSKQTNGTGLKAAMEERGMTVRELAAFLETDQAIVSRYRSGLLPPIERRRLISRKLRTPQRELWPHA
jgi:transcriptional regulator with XRE-family HTH domain